MTMSSSRIFFLAVVLTIAAGLSPPLQAAPLDITQRPLFIVTPVPPLNMLVMGRDHKLFYEAYNDASDLNNNDQLDVGYKPATVEYFGYFDSNKCYSYDGSTFRPASLATSKQCSGQWSGDFLNYLTTARIDALRKVLYGGKRSTDSLTETVLERTWIPQDAHSWGKEYASTARDGYNIALYAPLTQPNTGRYHLFANVSLTPTGAPQLRVMTNSPFRVWNWLSIERPVAGDDCFNNANARVNCVSSVTAAVFTVVPVANFTGLTKTHWKNTSAAPTTAAAMNTLFTTFAINSNRCGVGTATQINGSGNSFAGSGGCPAGNDNYLTQFDGTITVPVAGDWEFAVDGDAAVDVTIDGVLVASRYGANTAACACTTNSGMINLTAGAHTIRYRHKEVTGTDSYQLQWRAPGGTGVPVRTDYNVRVEVCKNSIGLESNCKTYANAGTPTYKPTGILHDYGESNSMYFGLITGSYANNTEGGVLRKNVSSLVGKDSNNDGDFVDTGEYPPEVNLTTGQFVSTTNGIVKTLDALRIQGFRYAGDYQYSFGGSGCDALGTRALNNGECRIWGNPIAEMMYEDLRYFAGAAAATPAYSSGGSTLGQAEEGTAAAVSYGATGDIGTVGLNLPAPAWTNPYTVFPSCAKPFQTVISDINPSFDSGLPGNSFSETAPNGSTPASISTFNAGTRGGAIWTQEFGGARTVFIGQSGATSDGAPTAKTASSFGDIRGLSPEEPTKKGSYYAASVANYGLLTDINAVTSVQNLRTYAVALASPLPRISFPAGTRNITLVPFAKTVSGAFGVTPGATFQPTNQIVDFYVENIVNLPGQPTDVSLNGGRPYAVFRINYEDVEQGNDHDMDAIVRYEIIANTDGTVTVHLTSEYAAGSADQHMGYVISGTTQDGIYLEVRDQASGITGYKLDTPTGINAGGCVGNTGTAPCNAGLTFEQTRVFTPGSSTGAVLLRDPLYYAAKFGNFTENATTTNGQPDLASEWDADGNGVPDAYFLVTNALGLKAQLDAAFRGIIEQNSPTGSSAANGTQINQGSLAFIPEYSTSNTDWFGDVTAYQLRSDGSTGTVVWRATARLPVAASRNLLTNSSISTTGSTAAAFTTAGLGGTAAALTSLGLTATGLTTSFGTGVTIDTVINYLRGDTSSERRNGGTLRNRTRLIGDIISSQPVPYVQNFGYVALPVADGGGGSGAGSYGEFLTFKSTRTPMLFVGANDGMLHGFNASSNATTGGREIFGFVPNAVLPNLKDLVDPAYQHRYYVDTTPSVGDVKTASGWKTILVGATGAGGRSVFGLNVTDPVTSFGTANVLWEKTPSSGTAFADLGLTIGRPTIVLLSGNRWAAVFGNGYNSANYKAALFVVDINTGALIRKIVLPDGDSTDPNGLASVAPVDTDGDRITDTLYAGDYHGSLWKFDVSATAEASWTSTKLFQAVTPGGARQTITGGIDVATHHLGGQMVFFGTGHYFLNGDNVIPTTPPLDTFYGIWDKPGTPPPVPTRTNLVEQKIVDQTATGRAATINQIDWTSKRGWFIDLYVQKTGFAAAGERFVATPAVRFGKVFFETFTPIGSNCDPGGIRWQLIVNSLTGAAEYDGASCTATQCNVGTSLGNGPPGGIPTLAVTPGGGGCDSAFEDCSGVVIPPVNGVCDIYLPNDPDCPTPTAVDRCGYVVNVVPPGSPQFRLARPCGQQSWRQIQ